MATILTKKKDTTGAPSSGDLTNSSGGAELAVNTADKRLYTKDSGGSIVEVGINPTSITTGTLNTSGAVVFNDAGADVDFRVESDTVDHALFVEGSSGNVGIGASSPATKLEVRGADAAARFRGASTQYLDVTATTGGTVNLDANNGDLAFSVNTTERMRIDSAGNVGIGASPLLTAASRTSLTVNGTSTCILPIATGGTAQGFLFTDGAEFRLSASQNIPLTFHTNNTERARIDSSGNLLVGTTSGATGAKLSVVQTTANVITANIESTSSTLAYCLDLQTSGMAAGSGVFIRGFASGPTQTLEILNNGNIANTNNSYGAFSDVKLKENIVDATPKLDKLNQVRVVSYNLKGALGHETHKQIGVIAQELEQVFPGMVDESPDRDAEGNILETKTKSVKYSVFVPMLIKAIQEQQAIITALTARVEALEGTQP